MARDDGARNADELQRRVIMQEREMVVLADTIKELAIQLQQLAQAQVTLLEKHDDLLRKITDMDQALKDHLGQG